MQSVKTDFESFEKSLDRLCIDKREFSRFLEIDYSLIFKWKRKKRVPKYAIIALRYIEKIANDYEVTKEFKSLCSKK